MSFDLKKEEEVKEYINNLGIEYRFGCYKEKNPEVCHLLADYFEAIKKDFEKAAKVYKTNCDDHNFSKSCLKYGNYCIMGKGRERAAPKEALKYFEKGCEQEEPTACLHSGLLLTSKNETDIKRDIPKGIEYLKKSCAGSIDTACYYLSGIYLSGIVKDETKVNPHNPAANKNLEYIIPRDYKEAFKYSEKACELENIYACANLSRMYLKGDGVSKNDEKSEFYKKKAIDLQEEIKNAKELKFQQGLQ